MTDALLHTRRLRACLGVAAAYLLIASLGLLLRFEAHRWGLTLAGWQLDALWTAFTWHLGGALLLIVPAVYLPRSGHVRPCWAKVALAALPVLVLASADRIATVGYKAIQETTAMLQSHPVRVWTNRPGWVESRGEVSYRINSSGLRGPDVPREKADDERRILFLGDSVTFGVGLNEQDCFVWQLPPLAEQSRSAKRLTVVNCSVIGYLPWQEHDLLSSECLKYQPDVVVQVFCLNDPGQKFNLEQFGGATRDLAPPEPTALEWSGLYRMSRALITQWFGPTRAELESRDKAYSPERVVREPNAPEIQEAWRITLENMSRIVSLTRESGLPLAIVYFPHAWQIAPDVEEATPPHDRLVSFCREMGVPLLNLAPVYRGCCREGGLTGLDLFPDKTHPTPEANRIAARAIRDFLVQQGWID